MELNPLFDKEVSFPYLKPVSAELAFRCIDGGIYSSITDLLLALNMMSDDVYYYHVNSGKNDFSAWVQQVFNRQDLAQKLKQVHSRAQAHNVLLLDVLGVLHAI